VLGDLADIALGHAIRQPIRRPPPVTSSLTADFAGSARLGD
jgi:hypothetical protein